LNIKSIIEKTNEFENRPILKLELSHVYDLEINWPDYFPGHTDPGVYLFLNTQFRSNFDIQMLPLN